MPTLLLVDDDSFFSLSFVEGLKAYDDRFQIQTAKNGEEAVLILESQVVDLVISDLKMPLMDGYGLLAYMSQHNFKIPVIVVTAFGTPEIEKKVSAMGAFLYLEKPLDFDVIVEKIYDGLRAKSDGLIEGLTYSPILEVSYAETDESESAAPDRFSDVPEVDSDIQEISFSDLVAEESSRPPETEPEPFEINELTEKKEKTMNVSKLNEAIEVLKANVGPGLLSTDIFSSNDGQSIAGFNSNHRATALFNQISNYLERSLKESDYTELGRYYMVDLTQNKMLIVIPMGEYQWMMHIDTQKSSLGLLLNIAIPRVVAEFEEAMIG